jgi:hypothetical protein
MRFLLPTLRGLENQMSVMFVTPILVSCHLSTITANHSSHVQVQILMRHKVFLYHCFRNLSA